MQNFFEAETIERRLNVVFQNRSLLLLAFVHRSFWNENQHLVSGHNERLEFLGDSVLGLLVSEYLFQQHPELDEGDLSKIRSQLVDAPACAQYVHALGIENYLLLGRGEQMNRGKGRESIMADLFEALIGALYLDQDLDAVRSFFLTHFKDEIDKQIAKPHRNWKAEMQDWAQKNYQETPLYQVLDESGPAHQKHFRIGVWVKGEKWGEGVGSSKKEAQTNAAQDALLRIEEGCK